MKMIIAILKDDDIDNVMQPLMAANFRVTRVASTGGFFRKGSTTLLIGVDDDRVDAAIQIRPTGMSQQFERPEETPRPGAAFVVIGDDMRIGTDAQCTHDRDELFPWRRQAGRGQLIADQRAAIAGNGTGHMGLEIDRFLAEVDDQQAGSAQSGVQRRGFQQQGQRHGGAAPGAGGNRL